MRESLHGFGPQLLLIGAVVVTCGVLATLASLWQSRRPHPPRVAAGALILALGSIVAIGLATLTKRGDGYAHGHLQLDPLVTLRHYWQGQDPSTLLVYVAGNVALFVPLGFFLCLALRRMGWIAVPVAAVIASLVSAAVEVQQLHIWSRSTDIDDFLLNSLGGLVGALLGGAVWAVWLFARGRVERQVRAELAASTEGAEGEPEEPRYPRATADLTGSGRPSV